MTDTPRTRGHQLFRRSQGWKFVHPVTHFHLRIHAFNIHFSPEPNIIFGGWRQKCVKRKCKRELYVTFLYFNISRVLRMALLRENVYLSTTSGAGAEISNTFLSNVGRSLRFYYLSSYQDSADCRWLHCALIHGQFSDKSAVAIRSTMTSRYLWRRTTALRCRSSATQVQVSVVHTFTSLLPCSYYPVLS